jgi:hypothetical protein
VDLDGKGVIRTVKMGVFLHKLCVFRHLNSITNVCTRGVQKVTKVLLRAGCLFPELIIHKVFHNRVENAEAA